MRHLQPIYLPQTDADERRPFPRTTCPGKNSSALRAINPLIVLSIIGDDSLMPKFIDWCECSEVTAARSARTFVSARSAETNNLLSVSVCVCLRLIYCFILLLYVCVCG